VDHRYHRASNWGREGALRGGDGRLLPVDRGLVDRRAHAHRVGHRRARDGHRPATTRETHRRLAHDPALRPRRQHTSIAFAETLNLEGIAASIGSVGDAYDNALAESTIGLFKTEVISRNSSFRLHPAKTVDDIEYATMEWVDWYNTRRLHSVLGYIPPDEFEATYYAQPAALQPEPPPA
jgi:putative transposase